MDPQEHVIEIEFEDRPRLAFEIFEVFEQHSIDKSSLEVVSHQGKLFMAVKIRCPGNVQTSQVTEQISAIPSVVAVRFRDYMPYEEKERQLQTILNSVSEGIIALDAEGNVQHMNDTACRMFACSHDAIIGKSAALVFPPHAAILESLKAGLPFSNKEQRIRLGGKEMHFFISCTPVLNPKNAVIGVVASIKDYQQAEEITSKMNQQWSNVSFEAIVHQSAIMKQIIGIARIVAQGTSTILLRGESGTGKELFAKAIHFESKRCSAPFLAINCGALPDTLLESELFGYEPGSFTGALRSGKKGLFEQADNGTLFLDEIGEISPQMQVRLLRVLQEQTIRRIGGERDIPVNVRIIAATNRNLEGLIKQGLFREDLYYRLNVIPLTIPPLRERREDIPLIAQHLIRKICLKLGKPEKYLTNESLAFLLAQDYPGNIRQLENVLELAVNLEQTQALHLTYFANLAAHPPAASRADASEIRIPLPADGNWPPLKEIMRQVEKQILARIMADAPSSRKAGNRLGVSNTTILKKRKKHNL